MWAGIARSGASKKNTCPYCGCKDLKTTNCTGELGVHDETWTKCTSCGRLKYHWAYGIEYVNDWVDRGVPPPARCKIRTFMRKLLSKKPKTR